MNVVRLGCSVFLFCLLALAPPALTSCEGARLPPAAERTAGALVPVLAEFGAAAVALYATAAVREHAPEAFAALDQNADGVLELDELASAADLSSPRLAVAIAAAVQKAVASPAPDK
jgi:hypothetical protein